jgi:TolA-binding protein
MRARGVLFPALAVRLSVGGCAAPDRGAAPTAGGASFSTASQRLTPGRELDPGYAALEQRDYDRAISKADQYLAKAPHGEGSAEALYLKGRSLEGKNTAGVTGAQSISNLAGARSAYVQALAQNPKQPLLSYIRTSLGNVAYFQDDYPTAIAQLSTAVQELKDSEIKGWALYRIGLSQQRLGQFQQADETFAKIERDFRGSEPARRSAEHLGARGFYVQLATYADRATADKNAADLKARGITAVVAPATEGHSLLRAGPVASYNQAKYLKTQLAAQFPDSVVVP